VTTLAQKSTFVTPHIVMSPRRRAWARFTRNQFGVAGTLIVLFFVVCAVLAPFISPFDYETTDAINAYKFPGELPDHLLGTDESGRDVLTRLIWGARTSLVVALVSQGFMLAIALGLGFTSAWLGGTVDFAVNRLIEICVALPALLFRILFIVALGSGVPNLILAIALIGWPELARLVRAQVLSYRQREFIEAARALGASPWRIALRHILPNIINPLVVALTLSIPTVIILESSLSFLGYGISEPTPSWGKMVGGSANYIQSYWHLGLLPTFCLAVVMIGFSFFGDSVRDLLDPRGTRG
jgi:oligopeptide transport system permease protein